MDRVISAGSRPISARKRSNAALRAIASSMLPPGMFHRSACSAITRSVGVARPPITIGGWGCLRGFGVAERTCQLVAGAVEVERCGFRPTAGG